MSIAIDCTQCGERSFVNNRLAGRRVRCPRCDAFVTVPEAGTPEFAAAERLAERLADGDESGVIERDSFVGSGAYPRPPALGEFENEFGDQADGSLPAWEEAIVTPPPISGDRGFSDSLDAGVEPVVTFDSDPVFEGEGHHDLGEMPDLPPSMLPESDDDDERLVRKKRKEEEMDMTPMVDVTFLLLIFFMVTASFSLQKSLEMPRQQSDAPSTNVKEEVDQDVDLVTVQVDEYGSFLVLAPDWERETPGKQNLIGALKEALDGFGGGAVRLAIEVHEEAKLSALVDCMDAGAVCGFSEVQVTQVEGFE